MVTIVSRYLCDDCGEIIKPERGKVIQGNVYIVGEDGTKGREIIGKTPESSEEAYCDVCLKKMLFPDTRPGILPRC